MYKKAAPAQTEEEEQHPKEEEIVIPDIGTLEWIYYLSELEGDLPTPIDVSITGSLKYPCPDLVWYNFEIYPHKVKITNTGHTVLLGAKWRTERPYLKGGPLLEKHIFSQVHFHWGADMMEGSEHTIDKRQYPAEMQVTFFRSEYMTQEEAFKHNDGVVMICYIIKYGVNPDPRLQWVLEGFPRIQEAQTNTRVGPYPMSRLLPMFFEDYFLYWGSLTTVKGERHVVRWLIPRPTLYASFDQMKEFRKLWDPWDEPIVRNFRPLQERNDRHVLFIRPHWNQYNSLLPIPRIPEPSISILSPAYQANPWMLPKQNVDLQTQPEKNEN
ncbi:carbonic anhydrase 2-like isoform X1 [Danaus plexippus]|uniref:Major antigen n=1 Tax=Danaus plexippus plexippus TaxID=278856 RepID=A0A212FNS0_DANPL|nr:carbonic anhydrase 2-like isoform X1 [Danaus plexippus]OWR55392.1 putative major antigen [Danaus plexippus plexippus]